MRRCRRERCGASPRTPVSTRRRSTRRCRRRSPSTRSRKITQIDVKASREIGKLEGGAARPRASAPSCAARAISLTPVTGTERGNIIGLGYSAYDGGRTVTAGYAEVAGAGAEAARGRRPRCATTTTPTPATRRTPKFGIKCTPIRELALRGTYAKGFRAPSPAENGVGGLAAFSTAADPVRCNLGIAVGLRARHRRRDHVAQPGRSSPRSRTTTRSAWCSSRPSKTSIAIDYFDITRKDEINQQLTDAAVAAGHIVRDPTTATTGVPAIRARSLAVLGQYVNSSKTKVRGFDVDAKQGFDLGSGFGKLTLTAQWTHLFEFKRTEVDGSSREFAGHARQLRRHELHRHAGRPGQLRRVLRHRPVPRRHQHHLSRQHREQGLQGRSGRLRLDLRRRLRCAGRLQDRVVHDLRPRRPLAADEGPRDLRLDPQRVRPRSAARCDDLRRDRSTRSTTRAPSAASGRSGSSTSSSEEARSLKQDNAVHEE